jgi:murein DD-endopeptidase MepM/ murein hydrolase activator NlpD
VATDLTRPTATPGLTGTAPAGTPAISPAERQKIVELAHEFESFFILQMVRQMRQSMLEDEHDQGLGAETMTDTMDVELGRQLANSGGIGLAQMLQTAIERQVGGSAPAPTAPPGLVIGASPSAYGVVRTTATPAAARPAAVPAAGPTAVTTPAVGLPLDGPVSSSFGWRADPFHGMTRFHTGVDIAAAYGRPVPAAGSGQVVFSGEEGGYGNTVVVEHPGGLRTRYAHLASIDVAQGQQVDAGTVLGRVGSSGRSTGPHLHFEVLQDGRPVDPAVAATRFAGQLKFGGVVAD